MIPNFIIRNIKSIDTYRKSGTYIKPISLNIKLIQLLGIFTDLSLYDIKKYEYKHIKMFNGECLKYDYIVEYQNGNIDKFSSDELYRYLHLKMIVR